MLVPPSLEVFCHSDVVFLVGALGGGFVHHVVLAAIAVEGAVHFSCG